MNKISRFVIWICSKFNKDEIIKIITGLVEVILERNPDVKPRDDFKEKHPNYRNFLVDSQPPLLKSSEEKPQKSVSYKHLLQQYKTEKGKELKPVKLRTGSPPVPIKTICPYCNAPHNYIYLNNGKINSQFKCKICNSTFIPGKRLTCKTKYFCPYCNKPLYIWKVKPEVTKYKCGNRKCSYRKHRMSLLNEKEKLLVKAKPSQFTINYIFREYHFKVNELKITSPDKPNIDLSKIHNNINTLSLILTFNVSYALSARKTAHVMKNVFNIDVSHQTVNNYTEAAAYYCHKFNMDNKGDIDRINPGDETYLRVMGKDHYTWLFLSANSHKISSYNLSDSRDTLPAISTMLEAIRTKKADQDVVFVTDGNPSYQSALHFINFLKPEAKLVLRKVIGLQNLDDESQTYRQYKQMIERLNRTYKHHIRAAAGFSSFNGAVAKTVLFVTHYNFLREHFALGYNTPIDLPQLWGIKTIQGKWAKIISLAA